jgi:hypothetical protein
MATLRAPHLALLAALALAAPALAGCSGPGVPPALDGEDSEPRAAILVDFRMPRDSDDEMEFKIQVTPPKGAAKSGTIGTSFASFVESIPSREWSVATSGDIQPPDPDGASPYPYVRFEDVPYNATWIVEVERTRDGSVAGEGGPLAPDGCVFVRISDPDGALTFDSPPARVETDVGVSQALVFLDHANATYAIQRLDGDTCADS